MKRTSLMRRLVGLGFVVLVVIANLPMHGAMSMNKATTGESQRGAIIKACGADEDLPIYKHSYALVIGQSNYQNWPKLPGAERDVQAVEQVLKEQGFTVKVLRDPTRGQFNDAIDDFKKNHDRLNSSRFLLYFSGHGYTEVNPVGLRLGYIVPSDAPSPLRDEGGFSATAISMNVIATIARDISPCHTLFVFDSCFSGSIFTEMRSAPEGITARTKQPVRLFITAGSATEKVPDDSLFRQAFVRGLQGAADLNNDKYVTGTELGEFLIDNVTKYSLGGQTPHIGRIPDPRLDQGDIVFALPDEPKWGFQPVLDPKRNYQGVAEPERYPQPVVNRDFQPFALDSKYYPSGWMGNIKGADGTGTLIVSRQAATVEGKSTVETRIEYKQGAEKGWAGIYWQHPDKNWGDKPGLNLTGAKKISFYVRGEMGGEIVEFISGCSDTGKKYQDQFKESIGPLPLTKNWTKYVIDLSKLKEKQLLSVIGAFGWVGSGGFDKDGRAVIYIADLKVE
jgi:hypothetical protein